MKTTDKTNNTDNPWAEGMKGSHDTSWLGRLWKGIAGAGVATAQVANAHGEAVREQEVAEEQEQYRIYQPGHPSEDVNHPDYYLWNPPE